MNSFSKTFLASFLAIFAAVGFLFIFSILSLVSISMSLSEKPTTTVEENTILKLTFDTPITDNPDTDVLNSFNFSTFKLNEKASLLKTVTTIEAAKSDTNIAGIYIDPSFFAQTGLASIEEVREALVDFKKSGKFIITYADYMSQGAYYLSSVSDSVYMNSVGTFGLRGLATTLTFYKGLFDKLDIEPQIIRHGKYKSFIEPFTSTEMSNENKEQTESLLNSIWDNILTNISSSRQIDKQKLSDLISSLEVTSPKEALKHKLIDGIKHRDEVLDYLADLTEADSRDDINFIDLNTYSTAVLRNSSSNKVAVIYAEGDIVYGSLEQGTISNIDIIQKFHKAKDDEDVKAIVFRINSGGGSALASELMWREIELVRKEKPVIVSFGDAAASGGYYIAAASDAIICSPTTITGSIGVFSIFFNIGDAMRNKLGVTTATVETNNGASIMSPYRRMTETEKDVMQKQTEDFYETFVNRVSSGRNLTFEEVDKIGQGRVWSGTQAVENGLVDGIGGLKQAIILAADKANIADDFEYITISSEKDQIQLFLDAFAAVKSQFISEDLLLNEVNEIKKTISIDPLQAKMPFDIELNTKQY